MKLIIVALAVLITGCANKLAFVGDHFDRGDMCQTVQFSPSTGARLKPEGYKPPPECNSPAATVYIVRSGNTSQFVQVTKMRQ